MGIEPPSEITVLLNRLSAGDGAAADQLLGWLYGELRGLAHAQMGRWGPDCTHPATAVVNEAYMRLFGNGRPIEWESRRHFFGAAARIMRQIRIDDARTKKRLKRGGGRKQVALDVDPPALDPDVGDILSLHDALEQLKEIDPRKVELIDLRYFAGLTEEETAAALGLSRRTVQLEWRIARAWLHRFLSRGDTTVT